MEGRTPVALHRAIMIGGVDHPQRLDEDKEKVQSSSETLHPYIFSLMGTFLLLLQVNQSTGSKSPFVTDHIIMLTFIVDFIIYVCLLATINKYHFLDSNLTKFMGNMGLCFGSLAPILLLLILIRAFGWFTLSLWIFYFLRDFVVKKSYRRALAYIWDKVKELFRGQEQNEEENAREHNEAENEIELQEMNNAVEIANAKDQSTVLPRHDSREERVGEPKMVVLPYGLV